jgi:hypothetical protein
MALMTSGGSSRNLPDGPHDLGGFLEESVRAADGFGATIEGFAQIANGFGATIEGFV